MLQDKRYREISGILLSLAGIIVFCSIASYSEGDYRALVFNRSVSNIIGPVGALLAHLFRSAFGVASYMFVLMFFLSGWNQFRKGEQGDVIDKLFTLFFLTISSASFLATTIADIHQNSGGFIGYYIYQFLKSVTGVLGAYLIIVVMNLAGLILLGVVSLTTVFENRGKLTVVGAGAKTFIRRFTLKKSSDEKNKEDIPLNYIGEDIKPGKKVPWIIKKKVVIGEVKKEKEKSESVKLLEMNVPAAVDDELFKGVLTNSYNDYEPVINDDSGRKNSLKENDYEFDYSPETVKTYRDEDFIKSETESFEDEDFFEDESFEGYQDVPEKSDVEEDTEVKFSREEYEIRKNRIFGIDAEGNENPEKEKEPETAEAPDRNKRVFEKGPGGPIEERVFNHLKINKDYIIPTAFLHNSEPVDTETWESEIKKNSQLLVRTLADFGIESRVIAVNRGPVITLYEMQIAAGIKINRVVGLADDIAMALAAYRVRIVAPIPGKSAIGIELPNKKREMVTLGDIIKSKSYQEQKGSLKVGLGKDILGVPVMLDLKKQPHLLIAGATGAGKSVCVNSIITSIVYNYDPNYVRFIMVDPKMVELQLYNGVPHLLTPVITEPHLAPAALKWSIFEMERRYRLLASKNARDIVTYNEKINKEKSKEEKLPFIIIIIDELADLMMVASKEIEGYITRIAQKARAVGIHLVLATQRPSVDVITGIIKANFPARIAFQVAQKTDSRTIIDQNGAEKLLGKGDMLYQSPMSSYPVRIQGAFISEDEIEDIVKHLRALGEPQYIDIEASLFTDEDGELSEDEDELFVDALKIVEETRKASASYLQRRLSIGYNRAARLIEKMEELGYVGPQQGSKPRDVFI
ncbi:MAG TPA: DNA translocase FtsK [Spirochaetota bacterium]|nr:DNA translocase FtsK [Spirochaetota bacterium]HPF05981.1 DNA translocase FtsK [Spirochaetota bacterium]HPJ42605.1 DNA translocase FtsK [Spirochaetota bacterium]HRX47184.1 DNA translocase FtsK [Spirochaetota bacterium]